MKPRVCMCCGELMPAGGGPLSRNPNICASCSSLLDGLEPGESDVESDPTAGSRQIPVIDDPKAPANQQPASSEACPNQRD